MTPLILAGPGDEAAAAAVAAAAGGELGARLIRRFPDGELFVRLDADVAGREVWVVSSLHPADEKLLAAYLLGATARDLGAARVGLAAPYLAYLRQDARFGGGEAVTSRYVARQLALAFDRLVAVDPHLHRYRSLDEVYDIPSKVVASAPRIAAYLRGRVARPIVVGPDAESHQWVEAVARELGAPHVVLEKTRRGDRDVSVSALPADLAWSELEPIVVDDIVSTARTMIETLGELARVGAAPAVCVAIHPVLAEGAEAALRAAGARALASCDTIRHPTNAIAVLDLVGRALVGPW